MALSVETLTWDCRSPEVIARFWAEVLGYDLVELDEELVDALWRGAVCFDSHEPRLSVDPELGQRRQTRGSRRALRRRLAATGDNPHIVGLP